MRHSTETPALLATPVHGADKLLATRPVEKDPQEEHQITPKRIEALQGVGISSVAALNTCTFAVSKLGAVYSWGHNMHGSLGHGDTESRLLPELMAGGRALK